MNEVATESLIGKGLIKERYDNQKDDLVRNLTPQGFSELLELLKDPLYRRVYLLMKKGVPQEQINQFIRIWEKKVSTK